MELPFASWLPEGVVLSAFVAAITGLVVAKITTRTQLKIAEKSRLSQVEIAEKSASSQLRVLELNSKHQLELQYLTINDGRTKSEINLERQKLEQMHKILSKVQLENSQTMSYMQSRDTKVSLFRERYLDNCLRLHEAQAIAALYYPEMVEKLNEIYGSANIFWGYQENLMETDSKENKFGWDNALQKVLEAGNKIDSLSMSLKFQISARGKELTNVLKGSEKFT